MTGILLPSERLWYSRMAPPGGLGTLAAAMQDLGMRRVLDLGCGMGRHLVFLARRDFEMYGADIDSYRLARAQIWLKLEELFVRLTVADMEDLPYPSGFFDAVISMYVIHRNLMDGIHRTVAEVRRTLRPGGWFFAAVSAQGHLIEGRWTEIEPGTWLRCDPRRGVPRPHYLFCVEELYSVWEGFRILDLERLERNLVNVHSGEFGQIVYWEVWAERV